MNTAINGLYARVSLAFAYLIDTKLIAFVRNVITLMTGNTDYPTPSPTLGAVTTSVNAFEVTVHDALDGGKIAIATRNAARDELLSNVRQLAAYVQGHCQNDLVDLLGSGFDAVKAPTPSQVPATPGNQRLDPTGVSGEMQLKFDRVQYAVNYTLQTSESPSGPWQERGLSTASRVTLNGFTPGKVYWARACGNGSQGTSDFGGPATAMAV